MWDTLWIDGRIATFDPAISAPYGLIERGAVASKDGAIAWAGPVDQLPRKPESLARKTISFAGNVLTPGLIDCHTHLVYAGDRSGEFEARLLGETYEEIARRGGGIMSTVNATRAASEDELLAQTLPRLDALISEGVTTIEVKSGYGLDLETESKMLRVARRLAKERSISVKTTFLGAHAVPPEFKDQADAYIDHICDVMLDAIYGEGLADAVDGFCEGNWLYTWANKTRL